LDIYTIAFIALAAVATWLLHRRHRRKSTPELETARSRWIYVPLVSALVLWVATFLTFGVGVLLVPVGVGLPDVASRRTTGHNLAFWAGTEL